MALSDVQGAWVNWTSYTIPVWNQVGDFGKGHHTAGGTQIGSLYPNEMYTTRIRGNSLTYHEIRFRNSSGVMGTGYIETYPDGHTWPKAPWVTGQEPYHLLNSNGSSLVSAATEVIGGITYRLFTVHGSARPCLDADGVTMPAIPVGTTLATNESTTGNTNAGHMVFHKKKGSSTGGVWYPCCVPTGSGHDYGFVDLGFTVGSEPSTRPIR